MSDWQSMIDRINQAETKEGFRKLHESLDRLYNAGIFTVSEFRRLDLKLIDAQIAKGY